MGKLVVVALCALGAIGGILIPPAAGAARFSTLPKIVDDIPAAFTKPVCAVSEGDNELPDEDVEGSSLVVDAVWSPHLDLGQWFRVSTISACEPLPAISRAMIAKGLQGQ